MGKRSEGGDLRRSLPMAPPSSAVAGTMSCHGEFQRPIVPSVQPSSSLECAPQQGISMAGHFLPAAGSGSVGSKRKFRGGSNLDQV